MLHGELLIDGTFVGGPCDQSVGKVLSRAPWNGHVLGTAAEGGYLELRTAVTAAHEAFQTWRNSSLENRRELLLRIAALVRERRGELVELLSQEVGKPITLSRGEVDRLALTFEFAADAALDLAPRRVDLSKDPRGADYSAQVVRVPLGVVFGIVPYNWPFNLAAHKLAPAIASGNTIVLKAPPQAPLSTLTLARLIHEARCPPGVVNAWYGEARDAERTLRDDSRIAMLSFTGSAPVGWHLKSLLPDRPVTLELGGDAFAVVHQDADLEWAAHRIVNGAFGYAGQVCISVQHVLVHQTRHEELRQMLTDLTRDFPTGNPLEEEILCGPMISEEAAERVDSWVQEAIDLGAHALVRGERNRTMLRPTLLENVPDSAKIAREEGFGPVLTLAPYENIDEAITRVNASSFGIHTGVFTRNEDVIQRALRDLEVGGVVINDTPNVRFDNLPYGGTKQSGFGREGVAYAIREMTQPKSWVIRN